MAHVDGVANGQRDLKESTAAETDAADHADDVTFGKDLNGGDNGLVDPDVILERQH
eukprot:CAMPEP_0116896608 /NCGR_PEP_ID=MMETSP0467-20121206/5802_1 /TAXON_ID=283647 /ORGANISM="Mesodinium pulex, Strain SPMC105" /LENGTH=55 /DNA_ID=CAMNT_0004567849 /DNA_START=742 /DNA_END=909 /DNA_ORIENTATION=+